MTTIDFPIIKTERLLLRQFIASDLENVYKGLSDPEIIKYYGVSYKTLEDTKAQMQFFCRLRKRRDRNLVGSLLIRQQNILRSRRIKQFKQST